MYEPLCSPQQSSKPHSATSRALQQAFYVVLGAAFATWLGHTLVVQPLFPFKLDDAAWASTWLLTTCGDYYTVCLCLSGVIVATDGWRVGGAWAALCCLLGSPFACVWVVLRLQHHGTLALLTPHRLSQM